ncbi:MAG TPA: CvpA family protein [Candidatus Limnocylindria bacterium]
MELIASFTVADLVVLVTLALGVFAGFQQGLFRSLLNCAVVLVSFIVASQLKGPIADTLSGVWRMGTPEQQELWIYLTLLAIGYIGGYLLVRTFYRQTRIPIVRQVDEILGAIVGVLFVALLFCFSLVALDTFFQTLSEQAASVATILGPIYDFLNSSIILTWMQEWLTPIAGFIVRPFVPDDIEQFLVF